MKRKDGQLEIPDTWYLARVWYQQPQVCRLSSSGRITLLSWSLHQGPHVTSSVSHAVALAPLMNKLRQTILKSTNTVSSYLQLPHTHPQKATKCPHFSKWKSWPEESRTTHSTKDSSSTADLLKRQGMGCSRARISIARRGCWLNMRTRNNRTRMLSPRFWSKYLPLVEF